MASLVRFLTKSKVARALSYFLIVAVAILFYYEMFVTLSYVWGLPSLQMTKRSAKIDIMKGRIDINAFDLCLIGSTEGSEDKSQK